MRALAVLPVILFHAGFDMFSGGYVGVDVFFVISGYLITSILVAELEADDFSISRFYERRARRILPALFFVMFACVPFAYVLMTPDQLIDFSQSILAVTFFSSNILFWLESGYFAPAAELKPLLHTWSLAVEEQYYVLFPIFLYLMWRFGRRPVLWAVVAIAVASLLLTEWGWRNAPGATFYLAPTRVWELLIGSICAFLTVGREPRSSNLLGVLGLALIVFSIFAFDANTPFPSVYALVPVIGTALIILFAAKGTWAGRLLSLRFFVGVGLISYSAYLWHQPLFAFARISSFGEPDHALMAALAAVALLLAWGTWWFVEQPFRKRGNGLIETRRGVFVASGAFGAVLVCFGLAGHLGDGFEGRFSETYREIVARSQPVNHTCENGQSCLIGDEEGAVSGIAFVGDSHMGRYAYLVNEVFEERGLKAQLLYDGWCAPLLEWRPAVVGRCGGPVGDAYQARLQDLLKDEAIHTVVLAAEWANYTTGVRHGRSAIAFDFALDDVQNEEVSRNAEEFLAAIEHTVDELKAAGKRIIVIGPVPEYDFDVAKAALHLFRFGRSDPDAFALEKQAYLDRNRDVFRGFETMDDRGELVDVWPILCSAEMCRPVTEEGFPLYSDSNHLVREGMTGIVEAVLDRLDL